MKKVRNVVALVLCSVLFFFFATGSTSDVDVNKDTSGNEKLSVVEVTKAYHDGYGTYYIEGIIKNNTDKTYSYAQVTYNLYDASGAQIGTAMDNINNLEGNGTWKFKAVCLTEGDKVVSYKLSDITEW